MNWKFVAISSVAVNLALGAWLILRPPVSIRDPGTAVSTAGSSTPLPQLSQDQTPPSTVLTQTPPFDWSLVESTDYLAYITNLRGIGCPEQTIRDIIIADVNQLFAPRYAALKTGAPELAWWGRFDKRKPVRAELAARLRALDEEKKSLLVRLLGSSDGLDLAQLETSVATVRSEALLDFVPAAKRAALRELLNRHEALVEWSRAQWKGLPSDERDAKERDLRATHARDLAALLTPEELSEFELRQSRASEDLREHFGRADLTEAEFRRMYELRREFEEKHPEAEARDWKRHDAELAAMIGPDRFADIQRQNDSAWRAMQGLAAQHNLTPDAMQSAYNLHQSYRDKLVQAVGRMFSDPQQNPQPLRDLAAERDRSLTAILGPRAVQDLNRLDALPRLVIQDDGERKSYSFSQGGFED